MGCKFSKQKRHGRQLGSYSRHSRAGDSVKETQQLVNDFQTPEEFLSTFAWFRHLNWSSIGKAAKCFEVVNIPARKNIITAGEKGDCLYIITDGVVVVSAKNEKQESQIIRTMQSPEVFGEFGLIHDIPRSVDVDAQTPVTLLKLYKNVYEREKDTKYMRKVREWLDNSAEKLVQSELMNLELFKGATVDSLELLAGLFQVQLVQKGHQICAQGTPGQHYYIVARGELLVTIKDDEGVEVEIGRLEDGKSFGELSLLQNVNRAASVTAARESYLLSLDREDFKRFLELVPSAKESWQTLIQSRSAVEMVQNKIPFFRSLKKEMVHQMSILGSVKEYKYPKKIVVAGKATPESFFIIVDGDADVIVDKEVVKRMGRGDYFGEVSIVIGKTHSATVQVAPNSRLICLEFSKQNFGSLLSADPSVIAEIQLRALGRDSELSTVIHHPLGRDYFLKHVQREIASENLDFWREVEELKRIRERILSPEALDILGIDAEAYEGRIRKEICAKGTAIVKKYFDDNVLNLMDETRQTILHRAAENNFDENMFNTAQHQIYNLMDHDNYSRFRKSPLFTEMLKQIGGTYKLRNSGRSTVAKIDVEETRELVKKVALAKGKKVE